ncbi:hypothetical protein ACLIN3_14280 [Pseudomonas orientalis]|uniref:hypothetical protein n=1 Tax=Pseudomonas fluorescens group TaxID=136843 RepID=UPI001A928139|nr:hypothetical protein [Pseudomonas fluorescens]
MSVEAIIGNIKDIWMDFIGSNTELNVFWLKYFAAFLVWVAVTGIIYRIIRSEKNFGALNIARKHMIYGALMVVFSVVPGTYVWYAFIDFKHGQQLEAADKVAATLVSWSRACEKTKQPSASCAEPPDFQGMLEPVFDTMTQSMSFLAGLMGLLGGALGVNIITDGLLRRERPVQCSNQISGTRIRKTITLEVNGKVLQHETIVDYPGKP